MSSDEDSETAEWEREQMLRGTQSRGQKYHQPRAESSSNTVDATAAKKHVNQDIERVEANIESIKRSIGSTRLEMIKSEKRIDALKKHIETLEATNLLYEELGSLNEPSEVLAFLEKHKSALSKLPHDQKEMIDSLEKKFKEATVSMDTD